ncbi:MAG: glycosyltransferase [Gaiellaceae bacterium]
MDLFDAAIAVAQRRMADLKPVYLEHFSREQVTLVMNAVDVVVLTSTFEGSPMTVKEALACMTPVVSVDVGDTPELLESLPACPIVEREPTEIGAAILMSISSERLPILRERAESVSRIAVAARVRDLYFRCLDRAIREDSRE